MAENEYSSLRNIAISRTILHARRYLV